MSLLMMINKIQDSNDFSEFRKTAKEYMSSLFKNTSVELQDLIITVMWGLLLKMRVPDEEAAGMLIELKEKKNVGILFEHLKDIDVQTQREENKKVREEMKETKEKLEAKEKELAEKDKVIGEKDKVIGETKKELDEMNNKLVQTEMERDLLKKELEMLRKELKH